MAKRKGDKRLVAIREIGKTDPKKRRIPRTLVPFSILTAYAAEKGKRIEYFDQAARRWREVSIPK